MSLAGSEEQIHFPQQSSSYTETPRGNEKHSLCLFFFLGGGGEGGSEPKNSANGEFKMFDITLLISFSRVNTTMRNGKKHNLC